MAQDEYIRTALRVPPELHKEIHAAADAAGRSFNAEILERLQRPSGDLVAQLQDKIALQEYALHIIGAALSVNSQALLRHEPSNSVQRMAEAGALASGRRWKEAHDILEELIAQGRRNYAEQLAEEARAKTAAAADAESPKPKLIRRRKQP